MAIVTVKLCDSDNNEDVYEVPRETAKAIQTILEMKCEKPAKHAKWEESEGFISEEKCSACGFICDYYTAALSKYCMMCGAKMEFRK